MSGNTAERSVRVSEEDFVGWMAVPYAYMEGEGSLKDKEEVAGKAALAGDRGMAEIASRLASNGEMLTHGFIAERGLTMVLRERIEACPKPSKGDALVAAEEAAEVRRILDARARLDLIYSQLDAVGTTAEGVSGELRSIAQEMAMSSGWLRTDPWEYYQERKRMAPGIQFFIPEIDNITLGCPPGRVVTLTAWTSHGKSTLAKNMAYLNAVHNNAGGPFLTLEEPPGDVELAFAIRHSLHPKWKGAPPLVNTPVMSTALNDDQEAFLKEVAQDWLSGEYAAIKVCGMDHLKGKYTAGAVVSLLKSFKPYQVVYIDYMNVFKTFDVPGARGEYERINFAASLIRNEVCLDHPPVPLVQCCQIKRQGFERYVEDLLDQQIGGYRLSDLNEANEMEKGSAFVVSMFLNEDLRNSGLIKVQLLKGRGSAIIETPFDVDFSPQHFLVGGRIKVRQERPENWATGLI